MASGALMENSEGEETLLGLTVAEANFVVEKERTGREGLNEVELERYRALRAKHTASKAAQIAQAAGVPSSRSRQLA